jgi:hypothetical protein
MTFDDFTARWLLWVRMMAAVTVNVTLVVLAAACILGDERLGHVLGGGFLVVAVPRLFNALNDVMIEWPQRYARGYVRPRLLGIGVVDRCPRQGLGHS